MRYKVSKWILKLILKIKKNKNDIILDIIKLVTSSLKKDIKFF